MKDRIIINKNLIPYTFEILLGDIWYEIEVNYNETADLFTLALYKDGKTISAGDIVCKGSEVARTNVNCIDIEVANYADR